MNADRVVDNELCEIQSIELAIMKKIHEICVNNNITYFLVGGTLLGAVRHGGFIPWDEDLDIGMLRDDYNKFLSIVKRELPVDYAFMDGSVDGKYSRIFGKVFALGTKYYEKEWDEFVDCSGLWVDIFPIDKIDAKNLDEAVMLAQNRKKIVSRIAILRRYRDQKDVDKMSAITKMVCKCLSPVPYKKLYKIIYKRLTKDEKKETEFCTNYGSAYGVVKQTMPIAYYLPARKIKFGDVELMCPNEPEQVLTKIYKNYMELPPVEQRVPRHNLEKRV